MTIFRGSTVLILKTLPSSMTHSHPWPSSSKASKLLLGGGLLGVDDHGITINTIIVLLKSGSVALFIPGFVGKKRLKKGF